MAARPVNYQWCVCEMSEGCSLFTGLELQRGRPCRERVLIHCPTHSTMEFKTALADLREECPCPVCVDYFRDPVTIDCGHNFCHDCLGVSWNDLSDAFPCPVCRFSFPRKDFRRNLQLRDMTEIAKLLQIRKGKRKRQEEHAVCEKHSQFLTLFCMKDSQVLCTQCSFSTEHQRHYICPIKKAAIHHRQILKCSIEPLKKNVERVEKVLTLQRINSSELRKKLKKRKEEINSEFEQMRLFLQNEQEVILQEMQDEEQGILAKLNENLVTFSDHVSTLKNRLKEMKGEPGVVAHACNPSTGRLRQEDHYRFEASLSYLVRLSAT